MILILATLVFLLLPVMAHAWGPIAHLDFASEALRNLSALAPVVKEVLAGYPHDFLYGAVAADITVGKSYVDYLYNCHNWRIGFLILNEAKTPGQKSAAYGYLAHLAADIISHNFFVPYQTIRSFQSGRRRGHIYWEMRFDAKRPEAIWQLVQELEKRDFKQDDALFERMIKKTLFSFRMNKRIFNSILTLHRFRHWKGMVERITDRSPLALANTDILEFRQLAVESVLDLLTHLERAGCTKVDPTGAERLDYARGVRRELKKRYKRTGSQDRTVLDRKVLDRKVEQFLGEVKKGLKEGIYKRDVNLPEPMV